MKGGVASFMMAAKALKQSGVPVMGDVILAGVVGEISRSPIGPFQSGHFRGEGLGTRHLLTHGIQSDYAICCDGSDLNIVWAQVGVVDVKITTRGLAQAAWGTKRSEYPPSEVNAIVKMTRVVEALERWAEDFEERYIYQSPTGPIWPKVNVGAIEGGFGWRVSRTPHHTDLFLDIRVPPTKAMPAARREVLDWTRSLAERFPEYGIEGEIYVSAPGAEIDDGHELVAAIDSAHAHVFGAKPERDVTRWFSDASALTRYGIPTVNYGTSTGLMDVELGENLEIDGLVKTAQTYALVAMEVCEVA
jgi:acetylornithine deacetylase/succinyl-diaminopimelate desuccinylase-like protein